MNELECKRIRRDLFCAYLDGKMISYAHYDIKQNFIDTLWTKEDCRRKGVATTLVEYITKTLGKKLFRCPDQLKNDAVRGLSAKFGDSIGVEAKVRKV